MFHRIIIYFLTASLTVSSLIYFYLPLSNINGEHKFYVSTSNIEFNSNSGNLEIIQRVFIDDLEAVLSARYGSKIKLAMVDEPEKNAEFIRRYILSQWRILGDDQELTLNYLGDEYDIDQIKIFIEVPVKEAPKVLFIENKTLFDLTSDQQNVVHAKVGDQRRSLLLFSENPNGVLNFK